MADESVEQQLQQILDKLNASPVTNGKLGKLAEDVAVIANELPHVKKRVDENRENIGENTKDISALKVGYAKLIGMMAGSGSVGGAIVAGVMSILNKGS